MEQVNTTPPASASDADGKEREADSADKVFHDIVAAASGVHCDYINEQDGQDEDEGSPLRFHPVHLCSSMFEIPTLRRTTGAGFRDSPNKFARNFCGDRRIFVSSWQLEGYG